MTNAINLLDNMDGLAAGVVAIACGFLTATFLLNGQYQEAILPAILGGAALGFLLFNFNPASIFMGDSGSMFLGFTLGGIALLSSYDRTRNVTSVLITPVLIMLIPIFDTSVVAITRKLSGRPLSQGGRDHTSHRLVALGISERRAVLLIYVLAAASGILALLVRDKRLETVVALVVTFAILLVFVGLYLSKVRVYKEGEHLQFDNTVLRALVGFTYKRRFFEIVLDVILGRACISDRLSSAVRGRNTRPTDGDLPSDAAARDGNSIELPADWRRVWRVVALCERLGPRDNRKICCRRGLRQCGCSLWDVRVDGTVACSVHR